MNSLVIITDSIPCANGGGISQTLYNLLQGFSVPMYVVARPDEKTPAAPTLPATIIRHRFERFSMWKNRIGKKINPYIQSFNFWWQEKMDSGIKGLPKKEQTLVLVSTTEPAKLMSAWMLQRKGYDVLPYFMDDWMHGMTLHWPGNSIQKMVGDILSNAKGWMMISRNLERTLIARYRLEPKPCLVIHNPVDVTEIGTGDELPTEGTIIYAGSIWPMHLDALRLVADAVSSLYRQGKKIGLIICTPESFWNQHRDVLGLPGVTYGGFVDYKNLQPALKKGTLLLVTASFLPEHKAFSDSSVQTKLTDYMVAKRPVLFVGPPNSASGEFVSEWDCGFVFNQSDETGLSAFLLDTIEDKAFLQQKADNGARAVRDHFTKEKARAALHEFIERISA